MKKRLLALVLCFALAVSLLPVTVFADSSDPIISGLEYGKTYCGAVRFSVSVEGECGTLRVYYIPQSGDYVPIYADNGIYTLPAGIGSVSVLAENILSIPGGPVHFFTGLRVTVNDGHTWGVGTPAGNGIHTHFCTVAGCGASETVSCSDTDRDCECDGCGASMHTWQFKAAGNTLTGYCKYCDTPQ